MAWRTACSSSTGSVTRHKTVQKQPRANWAERRKAVLACRHVGAHPARTYRSSRVAATLRAGLADIGAWLDGPLFKWSALTVLALWALVDFGNIANAIAEQRQDAWMASATAAVVLLAALVSSIAGFAFSALAGSALAYLKMDPLLWHWARRVSDDLRLLCRHASRAAGAARQSMDRRGCGRAWRYNRWSRGLPGIVRDYLVLDARLGQAPATSSVSTLHSDDADCDHCLLVVSVIRPHQRYAKPDLRSLRVVGSDCRLRRVSTHEQRPVSSGSEHLAYRLGGWIARACTLKIGRSAPSVGELAPWHGTCHLPARVPICAAQHSNWIDSPPCG